VTTAPYSHEVLINKFDDLNTLRGSCYTQLKGSKKWLSEFHSILQKDDIDTILIDGVELLKEQLDLENTSKSSVLLKILNNIQDSLTIDSYMKTDEILKPDRFIYTNSDELYTFGKGINAIAELQDITRECSQQKNQKKCLGEIENFHYIFYGLSHLSTKVLEQNLSKK